jgi:hypothetical protein
MGQGVEGISDHRVWVISHTSVRDLDHHSL